MERPFQLDPSINIFLVFCIRSGRIGEETTRKPVNRKAVLVFADPIGLDLTRRRLPDSLRPLFQFGRLRAEVAADVHLFTSGSVVLPGVEVHQQTGRNFAERLERATEELAALGYEQIVIIGRDCPTLAAADISDAFAELALRRFVVGPDHRGGCYLIGLRAADRQFLRGIRWRRNTDCRQLQDRIGTNLSLLKVKQDLDSWADLHLLARAHSAFSRMVRFLLEQIDSLGRAPVVLSRGPAWQAFLARQQMPPPA